MTTRRRWGALFALPLAGALALAGCGQAPEDDGIASAGGGRATATPSAGPSLSRQEKGLKFAQCMREHGIDMPDPDPDGRITIQGGPGDKDKMDAASKACEQYAPFGDRGGVGPDPQMAENMRKFAQCMRDNGVPDFPDPDGGRMMIDQSVGEDPDFPAAQKKCEAEFLPGISKGGPDGPGGKP
ncbi:hypothetical protein Cs7R123_39550 [Catellatospora sp. TT07R-123]|uniref:hypothetical protein n=1 Tax=Catellatospora sp. TT07R-123 TaxID=2733863 RepID=UPI001B1E5061|nr:hypothetical protein [Catellatospora sp. TT07R-123]GHJ46613.1 hypothetical protein Cs7R123_39550 [Catellatospora sp. TT07R-123]